MGINIQEVSFAKWMQTQVAYGALKQLVPLPSATSLRTSGEIERAESNKSSELLFLSRSSALAIAYMESASEESK